MEVGCELEEAIGKRNYVPVVRLAQSMGRPPEEIRRFQEEAIKQLILECRNPQGAKALAEEYGFTKRDLEDLLRHIVKEAEDKKIIDKRQYDIKTMRYLTLSEWVEEHFGI